MRVFEIEFETDDYQSLLAKDSAIWQTDVLRLDGSSRKSGWDELLLEVDNADGKRPDFFSLVGAGMVVTESTLSVMSDKLMQAGELLPVYWPEGKGHLVNLTPWTNCLDLEKTVWACDETTGKRLFIENPAFLSALVPTSTIFMVPESCAKIFVAEESSGLQNGFKNRVESHNLEGLNFLLVWDSETEK